MNVTHPGGEVGDFQPLLVQYVCVTAAAPGHGSYFNIQILCRCLNKLNDWRLVWDVHAVVVAVNFCFDTSREPPAVRFHNVPGGGFLEAVQHMLGLVLEVFRNCAGRASFWNYPDGKQIERHV